jgi:uncharacterized membrane protein YeiH
MLGGLEYGLDLVGTASFAFSGAIRALDRRPDPVGIVILAGAAALGGGLVRDVVLDRPSVMLHDMNYLLVILAAALMTAVFARRLKRYEIFIKYFFKYTDAVGLGIFSAIGASLAVNVGLNPLSVLFIAAITGAGGGIIRDVLLGEMPLVLYREIYILAVLVGASVLMLVRYVGGPAEAGFVAAMVVATALRLAAIRWQWSLPRISHEK